MGKVYNLSCEKAETGDPGVTGQSPLQNQLAPPNKVQCLKFKKQKERKREKRKKRKVGGSYEQYLRLYSDLTKV